MKPPKNTKKQFSYEWAFDPFASDSTFFEKRMFGGLAAYLRGRMVMVLTEDRGEQSYRGKTYGFDIWDGILLPTDKEYHVSLLNEFQMLQSHPVLGKWLYLSASYDDFETATLDLAHCIDVGDKRFGIDPSIKKK